MNKMALGVFFNEIELLGGKGNGSFNCRQAGIIIVVDQDIYPHADLVTYPSLIEGFGNAFLEAIYFKKPLLVNRYPVFIKDIEPLGFDLAVMDGFLTAETVQQVRTLLDSPERREEMVAHNYALAARHFSFEVLRKNLEVLMNGLLTSGVAPLLGEPQRDPRERLLTPAMPRRVSQAL